MRVDRGQEQARERGYYIRWKSQVTRSILVLQGNSLAQVTRSVKRPASDNPAGVLGAGVPRNPRGGLGAQLSIWPGEGACCSQQVCEE